jgi:hypothetical protein
MKHVIFIIACFAFVQMNDVQGQVGFYYGYCELDYQDLTIGRTMVFTDVFSARKDASNAILKEQFKDYLNKNSPDKTQVKYFKKNVVTWGDAASKIVKIFGPFTYSEAHSKLRKNLKSSKSKDWLTLKINGFTIKPAETLE